jgi:hypothetical protein
VVQVLELGAIGDSHFIALEYVDGETLTALVRRIKLPMRVCARIIADAAAGLHAAHELRGKDSEPLNVVHRDVSPHNILISYEGAVKVVDFGVARAKGNLHVTSVGTVKGKFAYMAPEQARLEQVDRRADVFALGIVLYEITTRHRLFKAETEAQTITKVLSQKVYRPSLVVSDYPLELEQIVMRALERDAAVRYQTAEQLQAALEQYISSTGPPLLPSAVAQLMREAFSDRIAQKRELMLKCEEVCAALPEAELASSPSLTMGGASISDVGQREELLAESARQRRRLIVFGAAAGAVLIAAGAGIALLATHTGVDPKPGTGAGVAKTAGSGERAAGGGAAAARRITILIKVTPVSARILLDGKEVTNPYEVRREAAQGVLHATLSAPGFVSRQLEISLADGGNWELALERDGSTPALTPLPPAKDTPPIKIKTKRRRPKKEDDDLFGNPFAK